jgi:hypothetical protein
MNQTGVLGTIAMLAQLLRGPIILVVILLHSTSIGAEAPPGGASGTEPHIVYIDGQPLTLSVNNNHIVLTWIAVQNVGLGPGRTEFCTLPQDRPSEDCIRNIEIKESGGQIAEGQFLTLSIRMPAVQAPLSGYLGLLTYNLTGKRVAATFRQFKVSAPIFPTIVWCPIGVGVVGAILLCLYSTHRLNKSGIPLTTRMGSPTSWDFSKSWASNVTVAGALLSTALLLTTLPETRYINRGGYAILNLLFTLLVAVAPFLFNVFRKAILDKGGQGETQLQYQGYVGFFLLASGVTIWAVLAQMITLVILMNEFSVAPLVSTVFIHAFQGVIGLLALGVMVYSAETLYWTAKSQKVERDGTLEKTAATKGVSITDAAIQNTHVPLSNWAPL